MEVHDRTTRAGHLAWCKDRANEYVDAGDGAEAIASMISDLGKHDETSSSQTLAFQLSMVIDRNDLAAVRNWVDGFN